MMCIYLRIEIGMHVLQGKLIFESRGNWKHSTLIRRTRAWKEGWTD